jgi:hypothetical protein
MVWDNNSDHDNLIISIVKTIGKTILGKTIKGNCFALNRFAFVGLMVRFYYANVCTSTDSTGGRSRTIGVQ